jgi:hypothetical protein
VVVAVVNGKPILRAFNADGEMLEPQFRTNEQDTDLWKQLLPTDPQIWAHLKDSMKPWLDPFLCDSGCQDVSVSVIHIQSPEDLPKRGRNRLFITTLNGMLFFSLFDGTGKKVFEADEQFLLASMGTGVHGQVLLDNSRSIVFSTLRSREHVLRLAEVLTGCRFGYSLWLLASGSPDEIAASYTNSVVLALIGDSKLQVRIFDGNGKRVCDREFAGEGADSRAKELLGDLRKRRRQTIEQRFKWLTENHSQEIIDLAAQAAGQALPPAYPREFQELKKTGVATFKIPLPSDDSRQGSNRFAAFRNVRLSRVRVWVRGVKTSDGSCGVHLQQSGQELICSREGTVVPFEHDPVETTFIYKWTDLVWNDKTEEVRNPSEVVLADSSLVVNVDGKNYLQLIGPFSDWTINLTEGALNTDLDRSGVDAVFLEFCGFAQSKSDR